jgi:hypothetical protein
MTSFVRYNSEEWSALYQDGKLVVVGDGYLSDDYLSSFLKVDEREGDAYFLGREQTYENVAQTLDEVEAYEDVAAQKEREAEELRTQAARLEAEAVALREKASKVV